MGVTCLHTSVIQGTINNVHKHTHVFTLIQIHTHTPHTQFTHKRIHTPEHCRFKARCVRHAWLAWALYIQTCHARKQALATAGVQRMHRLVLAWAAAARHSVHVRQLVSEKKWVGVSTYVCVMLCVCSSDALYREQAWTNVAYNCVCAHVHTYPRIGKRDKGFCVYGSTCERQQTL